MNRGRLSLNTPGRSPDCSSRLITSFSTWFTCCSPHGSAQRVSATTIAARTSAMATGTRNSRAGEYPADDNPSSSRSAASLPTPSWMPSMYASGKASTRKCGANATVTRPRSDTRIDELKTTSFSCRSWTSTSNCRIASTPTASGTEISRNSMRSRSRIARVGSVAPIARGIRRRVQKSRAARLADRVAPVALLAWAAGNVVAEPVAQIGAYVLLAVAVLRLRLVVLSQDLRRFAAAAIALAGWQAVSPAVALWAGSARGWPRSGRYGQFFDTLAPALAGFAAADAPWVGLASVVAVGWALSVALGLYQHFVRWPFEQPAWFRTPVDRVRESFSVSGPPRYGAGGFHFHRLRFAHGAVAALGPTLAVALRTVHARVAVASVATPAMLLLATYAPY